MQQSPAEGAQKGGCDSLYPRSLLQNSKGAQICSEHGRRWEIRRSGLLLVLGGSWTPQLTSQTPFPLQQTLGIPKSHRGSKQTPGETRLQFTVG